jgi:DNA-binding SARP family transcriptional activator
VWFGLLGPLQVRVEDREIRVPAGRQRILLAALLLTPGRPVSGARLAKLVWDGQPPSGAAVTLRSYIKRLRQVLGPPGRARIITSGSGYEIDAAGDEIDIAQFEAKLRLGEAAAQSGAWQRAADLLGQAEAMWRGTPLADIPCQELQLAEVPRLEEQRMQAIQWRIEADLQLVRQPPIVS